MKYILQFGRILLFCFLGELLHKILPLPIPSSIYGLILLLIALLSGMVKLDQVSETSHYLIAIFPIMFVPAAAGVMDLWSDLIPMLVPAALAVILVTAIVMGVSGRVTQFFIKKENSSNE